MIGNYHNAKYSTANNAIPKGNLLASTSLETKFHQTCLPQPLEWAIVGAQVVCVDGDFSPV